MHGSQTVENQCKQLLRELLFGKALEKWIMTEEDCELQGKCLSFFKMGGLEYVVILLGIIWERRVCLFNLILLAFPSILDCVTLSCKDYSEPIVHSTSIHVVLW